MSELAEDNQFEDFLDINQAAKMLNMTAENLRKKAKSGIVPAAKTGMHWCFYRPDLVEHIRSLYSDKRQVADIKKEVKKCQSSRDQTRRITGSDLQLVDKELERLLG